MRAILGPHLNTLNSWRGLRRPTRPLLALSKPFDSRSRSQSRDKFRASHCIRHEPRSNEVILDTPLNRSQGNPRVLRPLYAGHANSLAFLARSSRPTTTTVPSNDLRKALMSWIVTLALTNKPYVPALSNEASGGGALQPLQGFMTNPAGA